MASTINIAADSTTLVLNGYVFTSLVSGDTIDLTPANPPTSRINSGNGGVTISERSDAGVTDMVVRVQRFSDDDVFLTSLNNQRPIEIVNGSSKEQFTRDGVDGVETWTLSDGSITVAAPKVKNNVEGNAVSEWTLQFRNAIRII